MHSVKILTLQMVSVYHVMEGMHYLMDNALKALINMEINYVQNGEKIFV